jgi:formylglycine-generating enzyme required for sulfatase activity
LRASRFVAIAAVFALAGSGCSRDGENAGNAGRATDAAGGQVLAAGDDRIAESLTWRPPPVEVDQQRLPAARRQAATALEQGHLYEDADSAIPLYLAILRQVPGDAAAATGLARAQAALLAQGDAALAAAGDDITALRKAHVIASVARAIAAGNAQVHGYLQRVDRADTLWELNRAAEADLREDRLGESGGGALARLREALDIAPTQARALQGLAAVESGLIRRAEAAGMRGEFDAAKRWLALAAAVRPRARKPGAHEPAAERDTIADARGRIAAMRTARIVRLHDEGVLALQQRGDERDVAMARGKLAEILRIAEAGDPAAADLRTRIDLVAHYGLFHPGQAFTDALGYGARGPEMVVVPHGAFRMGAPADEPGASDSERPQHYIRFGRGFALSRTEVTVGEFRRFVTASNYRPTATRRGYSMVYEQRSGNFVRRNGVDWRNGYDGAPAADDMPVMHVSARDADAYAAWLAEQSGRHYHVPSEAQFEYALRAGSEARFPWGAGAPPARAGNFTGSGDRSPSGRRWNNAFERYRDGFWGPAPVATFVPNAYGLHDLAGNVSEWVADCWHDGYRRAPDDGQAWLNPGCRVRVMRGGAWASSPGQTRSAWRAPARVDTSNARLGFRVAREL